MSDNKEQQKILKEAKKNILNAVATNDYESLEHYHQAGHNFDWTVEHKYFLGVFNSYNITPLGHAIENGADPEMINFLMDRGANPLKEYEFKLNKKHTDRSNAIVRCIDHGYNEQISQMLNHPKIKSNIMQNISYRRDWFNQNEFALRFDRFMYTLNELKEAGLCELHEEAKNILGSFAPDIIRQSLTRDLKGIFNDKGIAIPEEFRLLQKQLQSISVSNKAEKQINHKTVRPTAKKLEY